MFEADLTDMPASESCKQGILYCPFSELQEPRPPHLLQKFQEEQAADTKLSWLQPLQTVLHSWQERSDQRSREERQRRQMMTEARLSCHVCIAHVTVLLSLSPGGGRRRDCQASG